MKKRVLTFLLLVVVLVAAAALFLLLRSGQDSAGPEPSQDLVSLPVAEGSGSGDAQPSGLTLEEQEYYDKNMQCLAGDYTNMTWHNYLMFGPGGTLTVIDGYDQAGKVMYDCYFGAPTPAMS